MTATTLAVVSQAILALALLAAYTTLTALGHDATILLGVLVGQGAGVGGYAAARGVAK